MQNPDLQPRNQFDDLIARLPLLWLSLGFLGGILFASWIVQPGLAWMIAAGVLLLLAILLRVFLHRLPASLLGLSVASWLLIFLFFLGLCLGAARYQYAQPVIDAHHIAWYNDRDYEVLVTGALAEPPDERDTYVNLRIAVSEVDTGEGGLPASGLILARISPVVELQYGDVVRLRGYVKTPPEGEDFSYRDYLARQGIHAYMPNAELTRLPLQAGNPFLFWIYVFKQKAAACVYQIFPDPEASLLAGILLNEEKGMAAELQQAFKDTGTTHIIAISGFNIAIIAGLFVTLFGHLLGSRRGTVAAVIGIALYTILVGAEASVVRAAIMGTLALFARQVGRRQSAFNTLAFTAAVMCAINPYTPWDVGFQLSFFATLGLVLYAQPLQDWAVRIFSRLVKTGAAEKAGALFSDFFLFTLAAQVTTLPIMAWHFKRISLLSLIANPFILPAQPLVMILGGLAVLLGLLYLPLGRLVAWAAWPFVSYTIRVVERFAQIHAGVIVLGEFSFLIVFLFYAALFAWTFSRGRLQQILRSAATPTVLLTTLAVLVIVTWRGVLTAPDGRLHLTFLDVGSADAILIQTPSGRSLLINGGEQPSQLSDGLGRRLSPFAHSPDWWIVASTQEQQVAALPRVLERFAPQNVLWAGRVAVSYSAEELDRLLAEKAIPVTRAESGLTLDLGEGARMEVLSVSSRGAVLLVEWGGFRCLLPIGINFEVINELENGRKVGQVTVLLLADSGYASSNPTAWLANLDPQVVLLSVAAGDPRGLPAASVLNALGDATLLRTDRNGWIEVSTDGEHLWLETEKK